MPIDDVLEKLTPLTPEEREAARKRLAELQISSTSDLSEKVQEAQPKPKPHWSQWIPVYGIFRIHIDERKHKPTLIDDYNSHHPLAVWLYLSIATAIPCTYALRQLAQLFESSP